MEKLDLISQYKEMMQLAIENGGYKIFVEATDKKGYVIKQAVRFYNAQFQSMQKKYTYERPAVIEDTRIQVLVDQSLKVEPVENGRLVFVDINNNTVEFKKEYVIETVLPIVLNDKIQQYMLYCNIQEVKKYERSRKQI